MRSPNGDSRRPGRRRRAAGASRRSAPAKPTTSASVTVRPRVVNAWPASRRLERCGEVHGPPHSGMLRRPGAGGGRVAGVEQRPRQAAARVGRRDDLVDVALGGGDAGAEVLGGVRVGELVARARSGSSAAAMSRRLTIPTACLAPITPSCACGQANTQVGAQVARVHRDEAAAEGLAQHHGDARHAWPRRTRARAWRRGGSRPPAPGACRAGSRACRRARRAARRTRCTCARSGRPSGAASASSTPPR